MLEAVLEVAITSCNSLAFFSDYEFDGGRGHIQSKNSETFRHGHADIDRTVRTYVLSSSALTSLPGFTCFICDAEACYADFSLLL